MTTTHFCYPDWTDPADKPQFVTYWKQNPNRTAIKHYGNIRFLTFMHMNGTTREKLQAAKELKTAEKKLHRAQTHKLFDIEQYLKDKAQVDKQWDSERKRA